MGAPIGNTNAASAKEWKQSLVRAMARRGEGDYRKTLDSIADNVIAQAMTGDKDSWMEVAVRMDGKPAQAIVGGEEGDPAINMALRVLFGRD